MTEAAALRASTLVVGSSGRSTITRLDSISELLTQSIKSSASQPSSPRGLNLHYYAKVPYSHLTTSCIFSLAVLTSPLCLSLQAAPWPGSRMPAPPPSQLHSSRALRRGGGGQGFDCQSPQQPNLHLLPTAGEGGHPGATPTPTSLVSFPSPHP